MKFIKKIFLSLGFCTLISVMIANPVSAQTISSKNVKLQPTIQSKIDISQINLGEKIILPDGAILTPISKDEYVSKLANEKNISIWEANEMQSRTTLLSLNYLMTSGTIYYYDYAKTFTYTGNSNFKADLEATLKIWSSGSFRSIENVLTIGSRRTSGIYNNDWIETAKFSDPQPNSSSFPVASVTLGANGYFQIKSTYNYSITGGIPGFSASSSVGGEYIFKSSTMNMRGYMSLYN
ncbi:MAG: hypothetical protein ACERKV_04170 [Clostridiaceae bacterium]